MANLSENGLGDESCGVLRLHINLSAAWFVDLIENLSLAEQLPKFLVYNRNEEEPGTGAMITDFDGLDRLSALTLVEELREVQGVMSVDIEWRAVQCRRTSWQPVR